MAVVLLLGSIGAAAYGHWWAVPFLLGAGLACWHDSYVRERAAVQADRQRRLRRELRRHTERENHP